MNEFTVNRNSWHYRWLAYVYASIHYIADNNESFKYFKGDSLEYYKEWGFRPYEFCAYWRAVLLWPAIRLAITLGIWGLIFSLMSIYGGAEYLNSLMILSSIVAVIALIVGVVLSAAWIKDWLTNRERKEIFPKVKTPSFAYTLYKSYKEKFCPTVVYKND